MIDAAYIFVLMLLVYLAFKYIAGWILPFLVAFCTVTVVHPFVMRVKKWLHIKQEVASLVVMILIYAILGVLLVLLILQLVFWIQDALALFPNYLQNTITPTITTINTSFQGFLARMPEQWQQQIISIQNEVTSGLQSFLIGLSQSGLSALKTLTGRIPAFLIGLVFTIMLSFFISMQYNKVTTFIKDMLPQRARDILLDTKLIIFDTLFKYLRASLTLMGITFIEISVGLLILGQKNAIPIAVGVAIFDALPFFGTGAIVIPWALIELARLNFPLGGGLLLLYGIIVVVRNVLEPKIVSDKLGLNPIVSLVAIYLGYKVFGVMGMIFMPILTQTLLALHKSGKIHLYKTVLKEPEAKVQTESPTDAQ